MEWQLRRNSSMPWQTWRAFPADAIVQIKNAYGDSRIGLAGSFWWGYEDEGAEIGEGVIISARRLDQPIPQPPQHGETE